MNKLGYTLIETLSIITIIGLIAIMASTNFTKVINDYEQTSLTKKNKIITEAACIYIELDNNKDLKEKCLKDSCDIKTTTLIESGLLNKKDVDKERIIHIYEDNHEKKCVLK